MIVAVGVAGALCAAVVAALGFILSTEYGHWGRRLGRWLVGVAVTGVPSGEREARREEWEAELEAAWIETDRKATGLVFALCLVARYGLIGLGRWLTHRPRRRPRTLRPPASLRWAMARDERTGRVVVRDRSLGDPPPGLS